MPGKVVRGAYDDYAIERVIQKLSDLIGSHPNLSFSEIAEQISDWRGIRFHREYFVRLRRYSLNDAHIDTIVEWIVQHHDEKFRSKLTPDALFAEVGESSRDFYFHHAQHDTYEAWEEEVLRAFAGVYVCAPANDRNSYLPVSLLRRFFADHAGASPTTLAKRAIDIKQYIMERSILILRPTATGYYHAAEFPMSLLFPAQLVTFDMKMVYEGVGIASGNSIRIFLRECLSRVGKTHSILIRPKGSVEAANPLGISINVAGEVRSEVRADWQALAADDLAHLKQEFAETEALDFHLSGTCQVDVSPVPDLRNRVQMTFARECVYHPKPAGFLRESDMHLVLSDGDKRLEIERIITNPLAVGSLR